MILSRSKNKEPRFYLHVLKHEDDFPLNTQEESLDFLIRFFNDIRPDKKGRSPKLKEAILFLEDHPNVVRKLQKALIIQLMHANLKPAFTKSGIPNGGGFWAELLDKIKHKLLPEEKDKNDFLFVINRVFYKQNDYLWIESIKRSTWISFFELFQFTLQARDENLQGHLLDALRVLSFQVANAGLEKDIADYITPFYENQENPFFYQSRLLHELLEQIQSAPQAIRSITSKLSLTLLDIKNEIGYIRNNQDTRGTSIRQTYMLLILDNRIDRMLVLLDTIDNDEHFDMGRFVDLFQILVRNENLKNSLRQYISQGIGYIAYQITEHKGQKGVKYITSSRKEYGSMFKGAMWGGLIICFVAMLKNVLGKFHLAYFWQGFWYSLNYSLGFIAIDQTGSTLATKQPAFTAHAVAVSLDSKKQTEKPDLNNLAITVAKVIRSQTASFIGNLIVVFPGTFLLAWAYHKLVGAKLVGGRAAFDLLQEQHPFQSLSLLYACNTGVFLFLSGIIAGYVQNKIRFSRIGDRLTHHPGLHLTTSLHKRTRWARFIEKHAGAIAGNISLGFFLGMAGAFGKIFGIPFDIRHITISAGNMAIGVYGLGWQNIPGSYLITVFLGVLGIGFFNFLISFSLAFFVAVKSRGIMLRHYPELLGIIWRYLLHRPMSFVFPPKAVGV